MATFYRPQGERFRIVIEDAAFPRTRTRWPRRFAITGSIRRPRSCGCDRASARRRCAPRTSWPSSSGCARRRPRAPGRRELPHGRALRHPRGHGRGPRHRRARRLGPGACDRQRAARTQRWASTGRLVPLQVRQCGPGARRAHSCTPATPATRPCHGWRAGGERPGTRFRMEPASWRAWARWAGRSRRRPCSRSRPAGFARLFDSVACRLRERSVRLTGYLEALLDVVVAECRARVLTPRDERAAAASCRSPSGRAHAGRAAAGRARRDLRRARAGCRPLRADPLYSSYHDCWRAATACARSCRSAEAGGADGDGQLRLAREQSPTSGCPGAWAHPAWCSCTGLLARGVRPRPRAARGRDLAARGLAVWNVEYRRLDCDGDWPAPLEDVVAAATALPRRSTRAGRARGHSAGGHLALLAARRLRVRACSRRRLSATCGWRRSSARVPVRSSA